MKVGVNLKIDVTKVDKARLFKGEKGTYLDATVFVDVDHKDEYNNNGMITQNVSKEEKEQGVMGNILGNCRVFWQDQSTPQQHQQGMQNVQQGMPANQGFNQDAFDDDIPF